MRRDVQSPALLIDAYSPQRVPDRRVLHVYGHRELATRRVGAHLLRERRQRRTEGAEQLPQHRGLQAEVVLGQQLLIWAGAALCQALSVLAREPHVALERGREACEIIVRPRAPPALLALGVGPGALGGEIRRYAARSLPLPSRHAHDVAVEIAQLRDLESGQPFPDLLAGRAFVRELRQRTQLVGPGLRAPARHHHQLIPRREHVQRTQVCELGHALAQPLQGIHAAKVIAPALVGAQCDARLRGLRPPGARAPRSLNASGRAHSWPHRADRARAETSRGAAVRAGRVASWSTTLLGLVTRWGSRRS